MKKSAFCVILVQLLVLISSTDSMTLEIHRSKSHSDQTGDLTPLVVTLSSEDVAKKMKGVDLICIVDVSGSMVGYRIELMKDSLKYLVNLMNEQDNFALITFESTTKVINEFTKMTPENKTNILENINKLAAYGGTNTFPALEKALELINQDYSNGERVASIILLTDGFDSNDLANRFKYLLNTKNKSDYTFTLHTFGYGSEHDPKRMIELARVKGGSYLAVNDISNVQDFYLKMYGSLSTICNVNLNLTIQSNFAIKKVFGREEMYSSLLYYKTDTNNKIISSFFNTLFIQVVYGKYYSIVVLVDIPQDNPIGTEVR